MATQTELDRCPFCGVIVLGMDPAICSSCKTMLERDTNGKWKRSIFDDVDE